MERVTFIIEKTGQRIVCMLNPESVTIRRTAGVRRRGLLSGPLSTAELQEDPLLYTGGGSTELNLDLLFDISLASVDVPTRDGREPVGPQDVRDLTRPIFQLTEGTAGEDGRGEAPLVRFIWGKHWNVLGVVSAVAERLEYFTAAGAPRRSWLRIRMLRVPDRITPPVLGSRPPESAAPLSPETELAPEQLTVHEVVGGGGTDDEAITQRPDEIASLSGFDPANWRVIFDYNKISDVFNLLPGMVLRLPPRLR